MIAGGGGGLCDVLSLSKESESGGVEKLCDSAVCSRGEASQGKYGLSIRSFLCKCLKKVRYIFEKLK